MPSQEALRIRTATLIAGLRTGELFDLVRVLEVCKRMAIALALAPNTPDRRGLAAVSS